MFSSCSPNFTNLLLLLLRLLLWYYCSQVIHSKFPAIAVHNINDIADMTSLTQRSYTTINVSTINKLIKPVQVSVEGVIGGSVCTHLGAKARPSPQTDTELCLFIVIYCPPEAQIRHLATNGHSANCKWRTPKLNKMYKLLASKQPHAGQCTFAGPVQHTGWAQRRSCERFPIYAI